MTCLRRSLEALVLTLCLLAGTWAEAEEVTFHFDRDLVLGTRKVPYRLSLGLRDISATRIGVDGLLDLQEAQQQLSDLVSGEVLVDSCRGKITITRLDAVVRGSTLALGGQVAAQIHRCTAAQAAGVKGKLLLRQSLELSARASAEVRDQCVYFRLVDLDLTLAGVVDVSAEDAEALETARALILGGSRLLLDRMPLCPTLPPELAAIDPDYRSGGVREIRNGGLGVALQGSLDVSPATILDVLGVLQSKGIVPPAP